MPQMAPMYWFILFIYFVGLFIFYVTMVYYFYMPSNVGTGKGEGSVSSVGFTWLW